MTNPDEIPLLSSRELEDPLLIGAEFQGGRLDEGLPETIRIAGVDYIDLNNMRMRTVTVKSVVFDSTGIERRNTTVFAESLGWVYDSTWSIVPRSAGVDTVYSIWRVTDFSDQF
jgi:hypothetical protein